MSNLKAAIQNKWPLLLVVATVGLWLIFDGFDTESGVPEKIYEQNDLSISVFPDSSRVVIHGLTSEALEYLRDSPGLGDILTVYAISEGEEWDDSALSSDGSLDITGEGIEFRSRYAWLPEVTYHIRVDRERLEGLLGQETTNSIADSTFTVARSANVQPEQVAEIYPSADTLPQNLLKFYIHFSGPMSRGGVYEHIHILDEEGEMIPDAFLELPQELWDPETTRLTILFDPGRIKRGLERHNLMGVAFEPGERYTLLVDNELEDGNGLALKSEFRKSFVITEPDREMPDHTQWQISEPLAGTLEPLQVRFDEPLDRALLQRLLAVQREGEILQGMITTGAGEEIWSFIPNEPWQPGNHVLEVERILEDLAGNNLMSVFDVDLSEQAGQNASEQTQKPILTKEFEIRSP